MFVQIIRAKPSGNPSAVLEALDRWDKELRPGAKGFLGSTAGVTPAGEAVLIARFEDAEAAAANSSRPEQGKWWAQLEPELSNVEFFDSAEVDEFLGGGSDDASFVQVMVGKADRNEALAAMSGADELLRKERPEVLGGFAAWVGDGRFFQTVYFSSEAEARQGESREASPEVQEQMARLNDILDVEEYLDLPSPRLS